MSNSFESAAAPGRITLVGAGALFTLPITRLLPVAAYVTASKPVTSSTAATRIALTDRSRRETVAMVRASAAVEGLDERGVLVHLGERRIAVERRQTQRDPRGTDVAEMLEVSEGEIFSVVGANGAGKTTLLLTLCGHIKTFVHIINETLAVEIFFFDRIGEPLR